MNIEEIHERLKEKFPDAIFDLKPSLQTLFSDRFIEVKPEKIHSVLKFLKEDPSLFFDNILCISGADYKDRFEVVYHFHSYKYLHKIEIKTSVTDREHPAIDTVSDLWKGANWLEREIYDMFGIAFNHHPDLRRILCPDDWEGHPLRKDYKHQEYYHDIKVGM